MRSIIAALALAITTSAVAQEAPPEPFFPGLTGTEEVAGTAAAAEPATAGQETSRRDPDPADDMSRVYLLSSGSVQFTASSSSRDFRFSLTDPSPITLSVGYRSGPGLSEENSSLTVLLNGVLMAREKVSGGTDGRVEIVIPAEHTREGSNVVELMMNQNDDQCRANESVWTDLSPESTYVEMPDEVRDPSHIDPGPDGFIDVIISRGGDRGKASAAAAITAGMRISNLLSRNRVRVAVVPDDQALTPDADLVITTGQEPDGGVAPGTWAPLINVQQISAMTPDRLGAVADATSGSEIFFREMGIIAKGWTGSQHQETLLFRLPESFFSRKYGNMRMTLVGSVDRPLSSEAHVDIKTNGKLAASAPLQMGPDQGRAEFLIPMTNTRAGINQMQIVFNTPAEGAGGACLGGSEGQAKFVIFEDSSISFPDFAEADRLSIPEFATGDTVDVILDPSNDSAVAVAASVLVRMSRSPISLPSVEISDYSPWIDSRNALIVTTSDDELSPHAEAFGVDTEIASRWRQSITQKITDIESLSTNQSDQWVRDLYDNRGAPVDAASDDPIGIAWKWIMARLPAFGRKEVHLEDDDAAFLVSRKAEGGGVHVLVGLADPALTETVTETIAESLIFDWDGRAAGIERGRGVRAYNDSETAYVSNFSPKNLRLVAANMLSAMSVLFAAGVILCAVLLGLATQSVLRKRNER